MKNTALVLISVLAMAACTSKQVPGNQERKTASLENHNSDNLAVLRNLPLFAGVEKQEADEEHMAETLVGIFTKIQDESHLANQDLNRGTHAKGSCFDGDFTIYSQDELATTFHYPAAIASRLHQGLFAEPGKLSAIVRFANAMGTRNADTKGDVRAISFSLDTTGREASANGDYAQDFMNNSSPMFAVRNIHEFLELMKAARLAQGDLHYVLNPLYLKSVLKAKNLLDQYQRNDTLSYATEEYWTNVPYSYGVKADQTPAEIVKFKMTPCDGLGQQNASSQGKAANYLQADIQNRAAQGKICFYMQAQLFDLKTMNASWKTPNRTTVDWVENGGELWDEKVLPFYTVAKLELPTLKARSCDDLAFSTRIHSTRSLQPLGSLARVRSVVEENSRARRLREIAP